MTSQALQCLDDFLIAHSDAHKTAKFKAALKKCLTLEVHYCAEEEEETKSIYLSILATHLRPHRGLSLPSKPMKEGRAVDCCFFSDRTANTTLHKESQPISNAKGCDNNLFGHGISTGLGSTTPWVVKTTCSDMMCQAADSHNGGLTGGLPCLEAHFELTAAGR